MNRRGIQLVRIRDLDDFTQIHHGDTVRNVMHHEQIVGDEQIRDAQLVLQLLKHIDDLRLNRHIQRRNRLVADDELRVHRECPGNADALPLAAGELMRIPGGMLCI